MGMNEESYMFWVTGLIQDTVICVSKEASYL